VILDTNALSAMADGDSGLQKLLLRSGQHQLPVIVIGEYRYGLKRSRERIARERWLDELEAIFEVLPIERSTTHHYAQIREELRTAGTPIPENDVWIAAIARQSGLEIASRDVHFDLVAGIRREHW